MLKRFLLTGAACALAISGAQAADFEAPAVYDWTGPYIGVHAGYGEASVDGVFDISESQETPPAPEETTFADDLDLNGFLGGVQAGYLFQNGQFIFGAEADISYPALLPAEADGPQSINDVQSAGEGPHVGFVAKAR